MKLHAQVALGNEAMRTPYELIVALTDSFNRHPTQGLTEPLTLGIDDGTIKDANGNTVGGWEVGEEQERVVWSRPRMALVMNRLPFVKWDRLSEGPTTDGHEFTTSVYGWIPREAEEGRAWGSDFVLLEFLSWSEQPAFATSSAHYSKRITEILRGKDEPHYDCKRVEYEFVPGLVDNKVVLEKPTDG